MTLTDSTTAGLITDVGLILFALASAVGGWRRGALVGVASLTGLVTGFWIGSSALSPLLSWAAAHRWPLAEHPAIVSTIVLLGCAVILQSAGYSLAYAIRRRLGDGFVGRTDSVGGTLVSLVAVGVVVWLAAGFVRTTPLTTANAAVADSRIVAGVERIAPIPSTRVLGSAGDFMERSGFPRVFSGQRERTPSVDAPAPNTSQEARRSSESVVRVLNSAPACGASSGGSGWVTTGDRVITNAHVVAGAERITVQEQGTGPARAADLIAFDPRRDIAVLHVDGLEADPLPVRNRLGVGDSALVAGYPGNESLTLTPVRVRQPVTARGLDIYGDRTVERDIYSLRATVRSGNSGGPLLDEGGEVAGMVFARSTSDSNTGYALTMAEINSVLEQATTEENVPSGQCLAR